MQTRRGIIAGGAGLLTVGCIAAPGALAQPPSAIKPRAATHFRSIEDRLGGRVGVCAIDTASGVEIGYRAHERFSMASTFKWLLAAAVLKACQDGLESGAPIYFTPSDLITYSPVVESAIDARTGMGVLTIEQLCAAIVTLSDNTAANLLLIPAFGPEGLTAFLRSSGDSVTHLDRREPELNENKPGDPRDTTTPAAMAHIAQRLLTTDAVLNAASREQLTGWLVEASTGLDRLRAGFPKTWRVGDKTGTGGNGSHNDVAIAFPPGRAPIVIASYMSESAATNDVKAAAHADIARVIAAEFG